MLRVLLLIIYLAFVSLGLPDGLLGSAWPSIRQEMGLSLSYMGIISLIISVGTVIASLLSDRLCRKYGTGKVTAVSVAMTAAGLLGTAYAGGFFGLCLWAIPYGLGAGAVDACLNNYVAIHYSGKHMSWLHCMWGLGATLGPYIMGLVMSSGYHWSNGYLWIGIGQVCLVAVLVFSLRAWKTVPGTLEESEDTLSLKQIVALPGAKYVLLAFFCYCGLEQTIGQWAGSYFHDHMLASKNAAASLAGTYYMGITIGRFINGFLTVRYTDRILVRAGSFLIGIGLTLMLLPVGIYGAVVGVILAGLGSAPIYPCIIHSTPDIFGADKSQALIGVEMAIAYVGICVMPPVFGLIAEVLGAGCMPWVLLGLLALLYICHERLYIKRK